MKFSRTTRTSHVLTTTLTNQPSPTTQPNLTTQLITTYSPLIMQYVMYLVPTPCGVTAFVNYAAVSGVSFVPSFIVIMLLSSLSLSLPVLRSLSFSTLSTLLFTVQLAISCLKYPGRGCRQTHHYVLSLYKMFFTTLQPLTMLLMN